MPRCDQRNEKEILSIANVWGEQLLLYRFTLYSAAYTVYQPILFILNDSDEDGLLALVNVI